MKVNKKIIIIAFGVFQSLLFCVFSQSKTYAAFHPGKIWNDNKGIHINAHGGGIMYQRGVYYWYGEHKVEGDAGNLAQVGVHCYSSKDLYNWKDEGIALSVVKDTTSDIQKGCVLERPKVIYNAQTKKYVMWFHIELKGNGYGYARSGVATASNPTGPFVFRGSIRSNPEKWPINVLPVHKLAVSEYVKKTYFPGNGFPGNVDSLNILGKFFHEGQMERDMTLFVDDDGKAYHIYASEYNATIHIAELTNDYLGHTGKYVRAFVGRWMEAPTLFKHNGLYYFIGSGCTGWIPNAARSAVAPTIWGPWKELGNPCVGKNSETTFHSQSTYVLPVVGLKNAYVFMADRWMPKNAIDGRYIWLPIEFKGDKVQIKWFDKWGLDVFGK